jgi:hypothetical protein
VGEIADLLDLGGGIDRAEFRALGDGDHPRLHVMRIAETVQVVLDELGL